ncbi:hypothetical protein FLM55_01210 [Francisella sp. Scap27]|uniref:Francisella virulence factor A n=1 Tax=Francisella sp. Scap27 TaxID=2589986 RepID=UPI0015BD6855|nr:hypothetical protein [Francisella sp. Scap27]QLE78430.1 hypothetical protein FLM55_01210 [Francisella sp. Scap27]
MSRFVQNIMYIAIILLIFGGSIFYFTHGSTYNVKGVYLPKYSVTPPATSPNEVRVYNLHYKSESDNSIGTIRTSVHAENKKEFNKLCEANIAKAVDIAARNGVHEIKFVCIYPEGELNELSSVSLLSYTFRD